MIDLDTIEKHLVSATPADVAALVRAVRAALSLHDEDMANTPCPICDRYAHADDCETTLALAPFRQQ